MTKQKLSFQAEVAQLLHLVTHSLYSNKEIFLRELISNASDACDKLRYEAINNSKLYEKDSELQIKVDYDEQQRTITVSDNGIGLTKQEAIDNLGTIAKSGTKDFVNKLTGDQQKDTQLIGQFGVGFYSGFIVAEKIVVESRKAGAAKNKGVRWSSAGVGDFEVENITKEGRGTDVILYLREDAVEFLNSWQLKQIINKYAEHISLPILMRKEQWQESEEKNQPGKMVKTAEWETVNKASALWTRNKKDITDEQYIDFYKQLTYSADEPLVWSHNKVEGKAEYSQLLYIPSQAPSDLFDPKRKGGLKLYVKRVFILDDAQSLLPNYLRFVQGVVDAADLPLNVSREILQESRDIKVIKEGNTRRILTILEDLAKAANDEKQPAAKREKYAQFYREFGAVLKEGLVEDHHNQQRIADLLRFSSTKEDSQTVSFKAYKERMKDGQKAIYYVTAESLAAAKNSPQLEMFRKKDIEVLLLSDKVDEWVLNFYTSYDDTPLISVAKGAVDISELQDEQEKKEVEQAEEQLKPVVEKIQQALDDKVKEVRVTARLVDSPACIVVEQGGISLQMQKLLKQAGQEVPQSKPILEINPQHQLIKKVAAVLEAKDEANFKEWAQVIFAQAVLAEGGELEQPAQYVKAVTKLLLND